MTCQAELRVFSIPGYPGYFAREDGSIWKGGGSYGLEKMTEYVSKKYKRILRFVQNLTLEDQKHEIDNKTDVYISKIESCENVAFVSWNSEIKETTITLKQRLQNLRNMTVKNINKIVSVGKESILPTRKGWQLSYVEYIKPILFKLAAMHESGISKQWKEYGAWRRSDVLLRQFDRFTYDSPHKLNLSHNIVVVYYVQLLLLTVCLLEFLLEFVIHYFSSRFGEIIYSRVEWAVITVFGFLSNGVAIFLLFCKSLLMILRKSCMPGIENSVFIVRSKS